MKCPKCGYNSFDYLENCKKCGKDLVSFKQQYGIRSVLFPGHMKPAMEEHETEMAGAQTEEVVATAAAAATATAASAAQKADTAAVEDFEVPPAGGSDDFGFDFMGESEAEEDLSFDELFEEAPADEDVEETLPEPEKQAGSSAAEDDLSFDMGSDEDEETGLPSEDELADDFGFDIEDTEDEKAAGDLSAADLDQSPVEDEDFAFHDEGETDEKAGAEEDPKDPFDQPGFSQDEEVPEPAYYVFEEDPSADEVIAEESDLSLDSTDSADAALSGEEQLAADEIVAAAFDETLPDEEFPVVQDFDQAAEAFEEVVPPAVQTPQEEIHVDTEDATGSRFAGRFPSAEALLAEHDDDAIADAEEAPEGLDSSEPTDEMEPAVPEAVVAAESNRLLPPVSSRIAAFACDLLLLLVVGTSFVLAAEAAMSGGNDGLFPPLETLLDLSIPYFLVLFSLAFGYFTLFHFLAGQTPGKMLAGLRVETLAGEPLDFAQAFLRSVGGLLQLLPAGLGYLVIVTSADRRGWNDRLAGTRLINLKALSGEA